MSLALIVKRSLGAYLKFGVKVAVSLCFLSSVVRAESDAILVSGPDGVVITERDLENDLLLLKDSSQAEVLRDPRNVEEVALRIYSRKFLANEAEKLGLTKTPKVLAALERARQRALADAAVERREGAAPSQEAIEKLALTRYKTQPEKYLMPEERRVRHILIKYSTPEAFSLIKSLRDRVLGGESFESLARQYSDDPGSKSRGGELELIRPGETVPAFERAAYLLAKPGEVSELIESQYGYHVIQLIERLPRKRQTFEEVRDSIKAEVIASLEADRRSALANEIMSGATVDRTAIGVFVQRNAKP